MGEWRRDPLPGTALMDLHLKRRAALALMASAALAACGGVKPYADQGPKNLELTLTAAEGGFLTSRDVYLDVWTGPKGPDMEYMGTAKFLPGTTSIGLPTGRPLHLALAFEEANVLGPGGQTDTIEIPMKALRPGQAYRITVDFDRTSFDHRMQRIR